jgi:hypothetical protein
MPVKCAKKLFLQKQKKLVYCFVTSLDGNKYKIEQEKGMLQDSIIIFTTG